MFSFCTKRMFHPKFEYKFVKFSVSENFNHICLPQMSKVISVCHFLAIYCLPAHLSAFVGPLGPTMQHNAKDVQARAQNWVVLSVNLIFLSGGWDKRSKLSTFFPQTLREISLKGHRKVLNFPWKVLYNLFSSSVLSILFPSFLPTS